MYMCLVKHSDNWQLEIVTTWQILDCTCKWRKPWIEYSFSAYFTLGGPSIWYWFIFPLLKTTIFIHIMVLGESVVMLEYSYTSHLCNTLKSFIRLHHKTFWIFIYDLPNGLLLKCLTTKTHCGIIATFKEIIFFKII